MALRLKQGLEDLRAGRGEILPDDFFEKKSKPDKEN